MEITWYGHSCFRLTEKKMATVVTDPFDAESVGYEPLKLKADIVTVSHDAAGHNYLQAVKGYSRAITGPGEFEIGGVFITGVQTDGHGKKASEQPRNTLYVFDYDGLTVAHMGNLRQVPTQAEVEALGTVNIVLVPVGGSSGLNAAKAAEVISLLEPNIVIPMHYHTPQVKVPLDQLDKFMKEMGLHEAETMPNLKVSKSSLPDETKVVVLEYQHD
ncbi:MAG: MBL fold metallo-hydrolase [Anaerolineales bacterium]|nr:MBL fold metallo-hydrolase [Anaerolineales bacterium]